MSAMSGTAGRSPVDNGLLDRLKEFGLIEEGACYDCGTCTAICPLTDEGVVFPRKAMRYAKLGMKDRLESSVEPWLCYYCGECSTNCPREAEPAEKTMAFRRYLTSVYDWTGLAAKYYTSNAWLYGASILLFLIVAGGFLGFHMANPGHAPGLLTGPEGPYVALNTFAPIEYIQLYDHVIAAVLSILLLSGVFNMWRKIVLSRGLSVPLYLYISNLHKPFIHFFSQLRFSKCENKRVYWVVHLLLASGYIVMFILIFALLDLFQVETRTLGWPTYLGYFATLTLGGGAIYFILSRANRSEEGSKYSHPTDWLFIVLLLLIVLTGILVHIFRVFLLWPRATYITYVIHLALDAPWLLVVAPHSKWAHLLYRPAAIWFDAVVRDAERLDSRRLETGRAVAGASAS